VIGHFNQPFPDGTHLFPGGLAANDGNLTLGHMPTLRFDLEFGSPADDAISALGGRDIVLAGDGNDTVSGGNGHDILGGGLGDDSLSGDYGHDKLFGGEGLDTLEGGDGGDVLTGGLGIDLLTGGQGADVFIFTADALTDPSTPVSIDISGTGIDAKNSADNLTDFTQGEDLIVLDLEAFGVEAPITYAAGITAELDESANFIVQTDAFANAGLAAAAIAANDAITADEGFFIYFNTTLGFSRLVYSNDLGDAGDITVLANFTDQTGDEGLANISQFGVEDFLFV
jgi:Ca2+-binding RTX toxin-like protein